MLGKNSIEARLCGDRLPTTIKQLQEVVTYRGNVIAVQIHKRNVADGDNLSIARFEVTTVGDGSVHQSFDFPHDRVEKGFGLRGGGGRFPPPHVANIRRPGGHYKGACDTLWTGTPQVNSLHFPVDLAELQYHKLAQFLPSIHQELNSSDVS